MKKRNYNRIKAALQEVGVSEKELAIGISVNIVTVSRWCTNTQQPTLENLFRIAKYLDIEARELIALSKKL